MDLFKKRKIQKWFRARWKWILSGSAFLITGLIVMLVGMHITGWNFIKWLQSSYAIGAFVCVIGGIFLFTIGCLIRKNIELME